MLHHCMFSLEDPSFASSWDGWGACCCCRGGSLWAEEGSAAWCPRGMSCLAAPFIGGMFAFPHLLCRWRLNLSCLFQQLIFHQKQPGWEKNGFVWSWMKYFPHLTDKKKKKKGRKKMLNKLSWDGLHYFFLSIFRFNCHTEKSIIFIALHQSFLFIKILVIQSENRFSLLLHWL